MPIGNLSQEDYEAIGLAAIGQIHGALEQYKAMFDTPTDFLKFSDEVLCSCVMGVKVKIAFPDSDNCTPAQLAEYTQKLLDKAKA